jgi:hypothetical protein
MFIGVCPKKKKEEKKKKKKEEEKKKKKKEKKNVPSNTLRACSMRCPQPKKKVC